MTIQTEKKIKENIQKNLVFYRKKIEDNPAATC